MLIKGCGKKNVVLTFYRLHADTGSTTHRFERIACGQEAESCGGYGVVLCSHYAETNGLRRGELKWNAKPYIFVTLRAPLAPGIPAPSRGNCSFTKLR